MAPGTLPAPPSRRLPGLDLARILAVIGMVLVHARSDLTADEGGAAGPLLELVQALATNRARLLFFLLAGVGVALLVRHHGAGTGVLLRRAAFLAGLGALLAVSGWSDLILVFYGVLFVLAVLLVRLGDRTLLIVALVTALPGVLRLSMDPSADDTVTNVLLLLGEMVPLFCVGLAIGRRDLADRSVVRTVASAGAVLAVPALVVLVLAGGVDALDVAEVEGPFEPVAALASTAGLCLLVLAACLRLESRTTDWFAPLAIAGGMPLTAYVGHALLFPTLARVTDWGLGQATVAAVAYLVAVVVAAPAWRRRHGSGPVEALMRLASGPRPDRVPHAAAH